MPNLQSDPKLASRIIVRSIQILSVKWTNKGYKIQQPDQTYKFCLFGAINQATLELANLHSSHDHLAPRVVNETALRVFGQSGVSVNDDLGLPYVIRLLALSLEELLPDAFRTPTYLR